MLNILGICWDYLWMNKDNSKGDFDFRQNSYAQYLGSLNRIVYSPHNFNKKEEMIGKNIYIYYTCSKNKLFFPFDAFKLAVRIIKEKKIDMLSAEDPCLAGFLGIFIKKWLKIPLSIQIHYDAINNKQWITQRKRHRLYNEMAKIAVHYADSIRVVSQEIKNKLIALGILEDKIWVIPVQIDTQKFEQTSGIRVREQYLRNKFDKLVLFVGRLSIEKNIPTLLKSFKEIINVYPAALLLIAGDGIEKDNLVNLTKELDIAGNVNFIGAVDYGSIPAYFAASDVFVLTSLREGRANVLIEAALSKKPIVTTNVSGVGDCVIDNKTGYIIEQGNSREIAKKITFLLQNPEIAKQFGLTGSVFVKERLKETNDEKALIRCWEETAKVKQGKPW